MLRVATAWHWHGSGKEIRDQKSFIRNFPFRYPNHKVTLCLLCSQYQDSGDQTSLQSSFFPPSPTSFCPLHNTLLRVWSDPYLTLLCLPSSLTQYQWKMTEIEKWNGWITVESCAEYRKKGHRNLLYLYNMSEGTECPEVWKTSVRLCFMRQACWTLIQENDEI